MCHYARDEEKIIRGTLAAPDFLSEEWRRTSSAPHGEQVVVISGDIANWPRRPSKTGGLGLVVFNAGVQRAKLVLSSRTSATLPLRSITIATAVPTTRRAFSGAGTCGQAACPETSLRRQRHSLS